MEKQKILVITNRIPYPLNDGGAVGIFNIHKVLHKIGYEITLFSMNTNKHLVEIANLPTNFTEIYQEIVAIKVNTDINPLKALINLFFSTKSYNIVRFESKIFEIELIKLLQNKIFDIIQLEGLYLAPYIDILRKYSKAKIILRSHNIEYEIWRRLAKECGNPIKKYYLNILAKRIRKYELNSINKVDLINCVSQRDAEILAKSTNTKIITTYPVIF